MSEEQQKVFLASGQVLSVSEAAKLTPYSQEYLSLLARKGRLPAVKIARDWLTTREAVLTYVERQRGKHQGLFDRFELANNRAGFAGLKILIMLGLAIVGVSGFLAYSVAQKAYAKNSAPGLLNFLTDRSGGWFATSYTAPHSSPIFQEKDLTIFGRGGQPANFAGEVKQTFADIYNGLDDEYLITQNSISRQKDQTADFYSHFGTEAHRASLELGFNILDDSESVKELALRTAGQINLLANNFISDIQAPYISASDVIKTALIEQKLQAQNGWNGLVENVGLIDKLARKDFGTTRIGYADINADTTTLSRQGGEGVGINQGQVLAARTAAPVSLSRQIKDILYGYIQQGLFGFNSSNYGPDGIMHVGGINNNPSANSQPSQSFGGQNFSGPNGMVQNGNGQTTSVIGGTPIVSYYPSAPSQNFSGGSVAGFTDLSANNFNVGNNTNLNNLNVTGNTSVNSLTVNGNTNLAGTTTIASLNISNFNPGLTLGSVLFQGPSGFAEDNSGLFYDATNQRLGIGTTTPTEKLSVNGDINFAGTAGYLGCFGFTGSACGIFIGNNIKNVAFSPTQIDTNYPSWVTRIGGGSSLSDNFKIIRIAPGSTYASATPMLAITNTGNVGIGTANPTRKLDVEQGDAAVFSYGDPASFSWGFLGFRAHGTQSAPAAVQNGDSIIQFSGLGYDGSTYLGVSQIDSIVDGPVSSGVVPGLIRFKTTSLTGSLIERMRITSAGNVGIGTSSPVDKLEVNGNIRLTAGSNGQIIFPDGSIMTSAGLGSASSLSNPTDAVIVGDSDVNGTGAIILKTGNTEKVRILNNGNIGIGTNAPTAQITFGNNSTINSLGSLTINSALNNALSIITGTTGTLNLDSGSTGAINIGTSAFAKAISIGNGTGATSLTLNSGTGAINIGTNAIAHTVTLGNVTGATAVNINTGTGNFAINANQLFVNKTSGNVGVGTAAPAFKLDVNGTINAGAVLVNGVPVATGGSSQWGNNGSNIYYNGGNVGIGTTSPLQALDVNGNINVSGLLLGNGGTSGIDILANGNVGINTTTPAYPLDVNGVINATGLKINGVDVGVSADSFWNPAANGISFMGGNVGIGTANPSVALDVNISQNASTAVIVTNTDPGTSAVSSFVASTGASQLQLGVYGVNKTSAGLFVASSTWITSTAPNGLRVISQSAAAPLIFATGGILTSNERMRIDNLGNIGIGTTTIGSKVVIQGTDATVANSALNVTDNLGNSKLFVANNGNVGIGTANPLTTLHSVVSGSNNFFILETHNSLSTAGGLDFRKTRGTTAAPAVLQVGDRIASIIWDGYNGVTSGGANAAQIYAIADAEHATAGSTSDTPGALVFATTPDGTMATVDRMIIKNSGNVGINTLTPAYTLDVNGSINAGAVLVNGVPVGTGSGSSQWGNNGSSIYYNGGNVGIGTVNPAGLFDVNGDLTVLSSGNVGIGTTSPTFSLDVISNTITGGGIHLQNTNTAAQDAITIENNRGAFTSYGSLIYGGQTQAGAGLFGTANRQDKFFVVADGVSNLGMYLGTLKAQPLVLGTNNLERVRIDGAGNVGIGTTTPQYRLDIVPANGVSGNALKISNPDFPTSYAQQIFYSNDGSYYSMGIGNSKETALGLADKYFIYNGNPGVLAPSFVIDTKGNIGIGTTAPSAKLYVFKGAAGGIITPATTASLVLENSDDSALQIFSPTNKSGQIMFGSSINGAQGSIIYQHSPNATSDYMSFSTLATERLRIDANGNLGLGATSPASALDIGTPNGSITFSDASSLHQIVTAGTSNLSLMPGGNVGINTINPLYKLDVNGVINAQGLKINGIDVLASSTASSPWNSLGGAISYTAGNVGIGTTTPNDRLAIVSDGINPGFEVYDPLAVSQFVVNANGNVGIGTTTPNGLLDVNGKLTVLSNGNVGIGVIAPASPLDVNGDIRIHAGSGGSLVFADGSTMNSANFGSANALSAAGNAVITADSGAVGTGDLVFNIDSSEKMRIANNGLLTFSNGTLFGSQISWAVGRGALTHILGPSDTAFTINSAAANALNLDSGTTGGINIGTNANAKVITIGNGTGATSLVLNSGTGAINIGTNAVAHILTLGNSTGATAVVLNSGTGGINIGTGATVQTVTLGNSTGATAVNINTGTGNFVLNANQLFVNKATGNVGIGTVNPGLSLSVAGSVLFSGPAHATSTAVDGELYYDSNAHAYEYFYAPSSTYLSLGAGSITYNNSSTLWTALGGSNIYYNGNIAIGTTTPSNNLSVYGRMSVGQGYENIIAPVNGAIIKGNVGIGTSSPNELLQVNGRSVFGDTSSSLVDTVPTGPSTANSLVSISTSSVGISLQAENPLLLLRNNGIVTAGQMAKISFAARSGSANTLNGVGVIGADIAAIFQGAVNGRTTDLLFSTTDATVSQNPIERLRITGTGNVGIGTSAPTTTLFIQGKGGANPFAVASSTGTQLLTILQNGNVGIGLTNPGSPFYVLGESGAQGTFSKAGSSVFASNSHAAIISSSISGNLFEGYGGASGSTLNFVIQNNGNVGIGTTTPNARLTVTGTSTLPTAMLFNIASSTYNSLFNVQSTGNVGIGTSTPTLGPLVMASGAYVTVGGVWTNASDKNLKENFATVTPADILQKIGKLPITEWNYKNEDPSIKHIGPVAQDFYQLFSLGGSDTSISTIDPAGVALLGIKALNEKIISLQGSLAGNATTSALSVYNPANFSGDSVGQGEILTGATSVRVTFSQAYQYQPIVTITPLDFVTGAYRVTSVDASGFNIELQTPQSAGTTFNWHSFASPLAQLTTSNGTTTPITLVVAGQQPQQAQPLVVANNNSSTSSNNGQVLGNSTTTQVSTASTTQDSSATSTPPAIQAPAKTPNLSPTTTPTVTPPIIQTTAPSATTSPAVITAPAPKPTPKAIIIVPEVQPAQATTAGAASAAVVAPPANTAPPASSVLPNPPPVPVPDAPATLSSK